MAKATKNFFYGATDYTKGDTVPDDVAREVRADLVDEKPAEAPVDDDQDDDEGAPGVEGSSDSEEELDSYDDLSKDELKAEAESRGLSTAGTKDVLIARLEADDDES